MTSLHQHYLWSMMKGQQEVCCSQSWLQFPCCLQSHSMSPSSEEVWPTKHFFFKFICGQLCQFNPLHALYLDSSFIKRMFHPVKECYKLVIADTALVVFVTTGTCISDMLQLLKGVHSLHHCSLNELVGQWNLQCFAKMLQHVLFHTS